MANIEKKNGKRVVIYVRGKGGNAEESQHYATLFPDCDVVGIDYRSQTPWEACDEFPKLFDVAANGYDFVLLIANSIGAYFSMCALSDKKIDGAFFISPIVDMEKLICDMCSWAGVTEKELCKQGEIVTNFGETLSWKYLSYVRVRPVCWGKPTHILYGEQDNLTSRQTVTAFADKIGATLTIMPNGEHWFHTSEQMSFLDNCLQGFYGRLV